ncbi:MAG: hypothetical protein M1814_005749 [Vezdaea aestivalis]|nr:MAG: hypothetical protein M1814_005749 [Vezdaea aestivalis]
MHINSLYKSSLFGPFALAVLVHGQAANFNIPSTYTSWDNDNWVISTNALIQGQFQSRLNLANGYLGLGLAAAGPFFEADRNLTDPNGPLPINGWPLDDPRQTFCSVVGFWDSQRNTTRTNFPWLLQNGGESVMSGIPHWPAVVFEFGGQHLDATVDNTTISSFSSSLSAKEGVAKWSYTWAPKDSTTTFKLNFTLIVSRSRPNAAAVRADITSSADVSGTVTDLLDGRSAVRSTFVNKSMDIMNPTIYSAVSPNGLANVTAFVVSTANFSTSAVNQTSRRQAQGSNFVSSNESTIAQTWDISLKAGQIATLYKFIGGASADAFQSPLSVAQNASSAAMTAGWDNLLAEHTAAWAQILPKESVDDYALPSGKLPEDPNIKDLQITSVLTPFYLLQNTLPGDAGTGLSDNSISVGGIAEAPYAGLVFWDADLFMSPGLVASHPSYARTIANYRIAKSGQARANARENGYSNNSILYPWTSARFGNCTATGPCTDYQYHLNSDIAQMLLQHRNISGDEDWWRKEAWPIYESVAYMYSELLEYNSSTQKWDIFNMTDPDEYANGIDNGAFTLASASKILGIANEFRILYGMGANETWANISDNVAIPYDPSGMTIEYDGMNNSIPVKQADVVLNTYPLDYRKNYTTAQSRADLAYYSNKQSPDGPAMTYGILSIIANEVSESGCSAYTYALNGFKPYTRAPWYQFSEQQIDNFTANGGTNPAFPFLTGHGGFNQVGLYGWLGMRTDRQHLLVDPALPPQISNVKLRKFFYGGATLTAELNQTHTQLTRAKTQNTFVKDIYAGQAMTIIVGEENQRTETLTEGSTLIIENRKYFSAATVQNNLLQCLPTVSEADYEAGQFPLAAVDGQSSTKWQPLTSQKTGIVIDMSNVPSQQVYEMHFDWAQRPPAAARVLLSNDSSFGGVIVSIDVQNIVISMPFDVATNDIIKPYEGNTTNVTISEGSRPWSGKYARLEIEGLFDTDDGKGATVAEFALLGVAGRM